MSATRNRSPAIGSIGRYRRSDYSHPGFAFLHRKLLRSRHFNLWRLRYLSRTPESSSAERYAVYLSEFADHLKSIVSVRIHFGRWRRASAKRQHSGSTQEELSVGDLSSACESSLPQGDDKYVEFISELHRTVSSIANLQTASDVLDSKLADIRDVFALTEQRHATVKSESNQANDKYEDLLRMVAEKKISHRDQVSQLQLDIGSRRRGNRAPAAAVMSPEIQRRLSKDRQKFEERMSEIRERGLELRSRAARLRMEYEESERENSQAQSEIESLTKAKDELGNLEEQILAVPEDTEAGKMRKLLEIADRRLQESADMIQSKALEIKELDYQIIRRRKILFDLTNQNKVK